ncbi:MAG: hypothetical protein J6D28_05885 [Bacilli bacterium]|nr:hypothetical protein [Bacilli bacterium]
MNLFNNPIIICGFIAMSIIFILIIVVVICCKRSESKEREELMALSEEIDSSTNEIEQPDKIEDVLSKMQEVLDSKEEIATTFEEEQEENAIISYQELLDSLGTDKINVDTIGVYEDELENQIEISDINKEIIDSYQENELKREVYNFQNDYSTSVIPIETESLNETPTMNLETEKENVEFFEEPQKEVLNLNNNIAVSGTKKFKKTKIISPVYGIVNNEVEKQIDNTYDDIVEEIVFDDDSLLDEF